MLMCVLVLMYVAAETQLTAAVLTGGAAWLNGTGCSRTNYRILPTGHSR